MKQLRLVDAVIIGGGWTGVLMAKELRPFAGLKRFDTRGPIGGHSNGGTIMGTSPANSVLNRYGQHWQAQNLFVLGGSAFPQRAGPNPTLTILAVTYYISDALVDHSLKQPGSLV